MIGEILATCSSSVAFEDLERDARLVAEAIERERQAVGHTQPIDAIEMIRWVFYRNKGAYLVGRIRSGDQRDAPGAGASITRSGASSSTPR